MKNYRTTIIFYSIFLTKNLSKMLDRILGNVWGVMAGWQVCALILCGGGTVLSYTAAHYNTTIPLLQLAMSYFITLFCNIWWWPKSRSPWWSYFLVAVMCFAGDWTAVVAYNNTSLSAAMLLGTTVIFWVAPIAYFVFGRKVTWIQILAMFLAIGGVSMIVVAQGVAGSKLLGNLLALGSALCYAVATILQEKLVKDDSIRIYLIRFGLFAFPLAGTLSGSLEWKMIRDYHWDWKSGLLIVAYSVLLSMYYMLSPVIMTHSNATVMNISMLSSNFYSLAIDIFMFGSPANWLYLVGFMCIPVAVTLFVLNEPKPVETGLAEPLYTGLATDSSLI